MPVCEGVLGLVEILKWLPYARKKTCKKRGATYEVKDNTNRNKKEANTNEEEKTSGAGLHSLLPK